MDLSLRAYRVWQRNWDAFLNHWATEAGGVLIEPLVMLAAIGYGLGTYVQSFDGVRYAEFVAPGIMAGYAMFHATMECTYGAYMRMETHRIYDGIIVTPLSVEDVTLGEILWGATRSVLTAAAVLVVATGFGLVSSPMAILVLPAAFLVGIMFSCITMSFTAVAPSINTLNNFFTLVATPMFFFSGAFFPLDQLPVVVQRIAWALPLTSGVHLMRGLVQGQLTLTMAMSLGIMVLITLIFLYTSLRLMRRRLIR